MIHWNQRAFLSFPLWQENLLKGRKTHTHSGRTFLSSLNAAVCISVLQMEVVSTFKRSGSFQGAVRRRSSVLSQLHDVNTISTPSHVALSTATANTSPAPGSESAERMYTHTDALMHTCTHTHLHTPIQRHRHKHTYTQPPTHPPTQSHTAARHVDCSILTLYGCVPLRLARCSCCVQCVLCSLLLFPLSNSTQSWHGCVVLVPIQSWSQARDLFLSFVGAGGSWLFSLCLMCPDRKDATLL